MLLHLDRFGNIPFALIHNHGQAVAFTSDEYTEAERVARVCRCGDCHCCVVVAYVKEREA